MKTISKLILTTNKQTATTDSNDSSSNSSNTSRTGTAAATTATIATPAATAAQPTHQIDIRQLSKQPKNIINNHNERSNNSSNERSNNNSSTNCDQLLGGKNTHNIKQQTKCETMTTRCNTTNRHLSDSTNKYKQKNKARSNCDQLSQNNSSDNR